MGEVWRARDTRLDRSVAIKVLPREFAGNAQLKLRFEREAKAISQLNHPNICTLHDVGEEQGTSFLVMELLDGETLADRLAKGPLPLAEVLRYGVQIADGLDRAHRAGIVHRDLKPGNIMITKTGAKLLDFGLAKGGATSSAAAADQPTIAKSLTQEGTIIGTFQYMAPEQLEGTPADARTDIFALGAVLYEMATGRRAFEGKTRTSLIAAIVSAQPPAITNVQPLAPASLDHVIATCLAKEPDARWQSAHDVAQELRWIETNAAATAPARVASRRWIAVATLAIIAAAILAGLVARERMRPHEALAFSILPPRGYSIRSPQISPDGNSVAFAVDNENGEGSIWIRRIGSVAATKILDSPTISTQLVFWSPDGNMIGFFDNGRILKVPAQGGTPETVCSSCVSYGDGGVWNRSGTILFSPKFGEGLFRVPASGGTAVRVTTLDPKRRETLHGWPRFLDDDDHFVYVVHTVSDEKNAIYAGSLSSNAKTFLTNADSLVGITGSHLLFVRDGAMYAQTLDASKVRLTGEPRKIADEVAFSEDSAHSFASVAANGALIYLPASNDEVKLEVGWYDRTGRLVEKLFDDVSMIAVALSPDDSRLAMMKLDVKKGAYDVYVYDIARGIRTKLTGGLANHTTAVWAPSGDRLFFDGDGDGMYDVYARSDDGASPARVVWKGGDDKRPAAISPDGRWLLAQQFSAKTKDDLWLVPLDAPEKASPFIATDERDDSARFSPDGKWICYVSAQSGRPEVYVRAFPNGRSLQVSVNGGEGPSWSSDQSEIYFLSRSNDVMAASFHGAATTPQPGKPAALFHFPNAMVSFRPSHKPGRFMGVVRTKPEESIRVVNYVSGSIEKLEQ
jgi:serine/threonine protein kinase/Tol biopolymer transport system component